MHLLMERCVALQSLSCVLKPSANAMKIYHLNSTTHCFHNQDRQKTTTRRQRVLKDNPVLTTSTTSASFPVQQSQRYSHFTLHYPARRQSQLGGSNRPGMNNLAHSPPPSIFPTCVYLSLCLG